MAIKAKKPAMPSPQADTRAETLRRRGSCKHETLCASAPLRGNESCLGTESNCFFKG